MPSMSMHVRTTYFRTAQLMGASRGEALRSDQERDDAFEAIYQWGEHSRATPDGIDRIGGAEEHRQWALDRHLAGSSFELGDPQQLEEEDLDEF